MSPPVVDSKQATRCCAEQSVLAAEAESSLRLVPAYVCPVLDSSTARQVAPACEESVARST